LTHSIVKNKIRVLNIFLLA